MKIDEKKRQQEKKKVACLDSTPRMRVTYKFFNIRPGIDDGDGDGDGNGDGDGDEVGGSDCSFESVLLDST